MQPAAPACLPVISRRQSQQSSLMHQPNHANQNEIEGHHVVEQLWHRQNQDARDQREKRDDFDLEIHAVVLIVELQRDASFDRDGYP